MKAFFICILLFSITSSYAQNTDIQKANQLLKQGHWQKARSLLEPIASKGNHEAQYLLATTYTERNEIKAFEWFMKSAKLGNDESQLRVGRMYSFESG